MRRGKDFGVAVMGNRSGGTDTQCHPTPDQKAATPMPSFPPLTHVALTVRDLSISVPWYEALFDAEPVLDEDTDPDFHHTVYLLGNGTLRRLPPASAVRAARVVQRVPGRPRPHRVRGRRPRRTREVGSPPRRARHRPRRHQGCGLRLGCELPRSGRHRPASLRSPELTSTRSASVAHPRGVATVAEATQLMKSHSILTIKHP